MTASLPVKRVHLHIKRLHKGGAAAEGGPGPTRGKANLQQVVRKVSAPPCEHSKKTSPRSFYYIKISVTRSEFSKFLF